MSVYLFAIQMVVIKSFDLETNKNIIYMKETYSELKIAFEEMQSELKEFYI